MNSKILKEGNVVSVGGVTMAPIHDPCKDCSQAATHELYEGTFKDALAMKALGRYCRPCAWKRMVELARA